MDLTITLPDHVAAAFATPEDAEAVALAALTDVAKSQALAAASDDAQAILREAAAPFEGTAAPAVPTVAEQVQELAQRVDNFAGLAVQLVALAGGDPEQAQTIVTEAVGGKADPAPLIEASVEVAER